ncbi:MAG: FAD-dependent oxidoreductase [Bdellovibrionales bacterium]|nr:FAD-dependent oxidoreductase [Bdellovibrionales bacterium]
MGVKSVDVLVVGGGIVGACVARELKAAGVADVLLVDKGDFGKGCSWGSAGWITPCFSMPLPQPGMLLKATKWMLDPTSPFRIKPELSLTLISWLLRFLRATTERKMLESIEVLTEISKYSLNFYKQMADDASNDFTYAKKGLLLVSAEDRGVKAAKLEMNLMSVHGIPGQFMERDELLEFEPAFRSLLKGGVYFPEEAQAEPFQAVGAVIEQYRKLGGQAISDTEVIDFKVEGGKITEVNTTQGRFKPDLVVMAAGTWSKELASKLGCTISLLGGKGYSMRIAGDFVKPKTPIMIVDRKIAITPYDNYVRLAGTLELVNQDFDFSPRRLQGILKGSHEYLKLEGASEPTHIWRGLRPCTPDGVPLVGFSSRISNLFYSVGHQMLGLQSAPGSARLAADLISGKSSYVDAKPFNPRRYEM